MYLEWWALVLDVICVQMESSADYSNPYSMSVIWLQSIQSTLYFVNLAVLWPDAG